MRMLKLGARFELQAALVFGVGATIAALRIWDGVLAGGTVDGPEIPIVISLSVAVVSGSIFGGYAGGDMHNEQATIGLGGAAWRGIQVACKAFLLGIIALTLVMMVRGLVAEPSFAMLGFRLLSIVSFLMLGVVVAGPTILPAGALLGILLWLLHRLQKSHADLAKNRSFLSQTSFSLSAACFYFIAAGSAAALLYFFLLKGFQMGMGWPLVLSVIAAFFAGGLFTPVICSREGNTNFLRAAGSGIVVTLISYAFGIAGMVLMDKVSLPTTVSQLDKILGELAGVGFMGLYVCGPVILPLGMLAGIGVESWCRRSRR